MTYERHQGHYFFILTSRGYVLMFLFLHDITRLMCRAVLPRGKTIISNLQNKLVSVCLLFAGSKHKTMLEARSGAGPIKAYPRPGAKLKNGSSSQLKGSGLQNKTFHCQICDVHVNSEIQLKQVETQQAHTV